jgi:hypothetical protein
MKLAVPLLRGVTSVGPSHDKRHEDKAISGFTLPCTSYNQAGNTSISQASPVLELHNLFEFALELHC